MLHDNLIYWLTKSCSLMVKLTYQSLFHTHMLLLIFLYTVYMSHLHHWAGISCNTSCLWSVVKITLKLYLSMAAYKKNRGTDPLIHNLGTTCGWVVKFMSPPPTQKEPPVPTGQDAAWASKLVQMFCRRRNLLWLPGMESRIIQPMAKSLHQLPMAVLYFGV